MSASSNHAAMSASTGETAFYLSHAEVSARPSSHGSGNVQLSPLFHWNLNNVVLQSLEPAQVQQLYRLFVFYNSSSVGDALPSLDCRRFVQILRDVGLVVPPMELNLSQSASLPSLSVTAVETIFAEAVMGKLRAYLDADQQPALTFQLFCGALLNCAMVLYPSEASSRPMAALNQLINRLFAPFGNSDADINRSRSSVATHVSIGTGADAYWRCGTAQSHTKPLLPTESPRDPCDTFVTSSVESTTPAVVEDFRQLKPFQRLIARFSRDAEQEAQTIARLGLLYSVADDLAAQFPSTLFTTLKERFQVFDVFDQGALSPREVFALLTASLVKRLDITDVYDVLALLLEPRQVSISSNKRPEAALVTLTELLQALLKCRRPKTTSSSTASAANSQHNSASRRKAANHSSGPMQSDPAAVFGARTEPQAEVPAQSKPESGKRQSAKSTAQHKISMAKQVQATKAAKARKGGKKLNTGASNPHTTEKTDGQESLDVNRIVDIGEPPVYMDIPVDFPLVPEMEVAASNSKHALSAFMLLGGEHDGAICYVATLDLTSHQLTESHGIYFSNGKHEMLKHKTLAPPSSQEIALLLLKKRLQVKEHEGFELHPATQMLVVDARLRQLQLRHPHYTSPIKQDQRATRDRGRREPSCVSNEDPTAPRTIGDLVDVRSSALRVPGIWRSSSNEDLLEMVKDSFLQSHQQAKRARAAAEQRRQELKELARQQMQPRSRTPLASRLSIAALTAFDSTLLLPPPEEFDWVQSLNQSVSTFQTQFEPAQREQEFVPLRSKRKQSKTYKAQTRSTGHLQPLALYDQYT